MQPIGEIIRKQDLKYHHYPDDLQLFCHFPFDALSLSNAVHRIEKCIDELKEWMTTNYLQMNDSKSEILPVIQRHKTNMTEGLRVRVGSDYVTAVRHVKNLGVYLDRHLDMTTQVHRTISTCSLHMRNIAKIIRYPSFEALECVVTSTQVVRVSVIRPPPSTKNKTTHKQFQAEFADYLGHIVTAPGMLLIVGDFNYHVEDTSDSEACSFTNLIDSFGFIQH